MGKIVDFDRTHTDVILSGGRSPESKDLRTDFTAAVPNMRRSFDSLRSLRMTSGAALRRCICPGADVFSDFPREF